MSYTITFAAGTGGTITGTTSQVVATAGTITTAVTAVPSTGKVFVNWTGTNGFVTTKQNPVFVTATASQDLTANFAVLSLGALTADDTTPKVDQVVTIRGTVNSAIATWTATTFSGCNTHHFYQVSEGVGNVLCQVQPTGAGELYITITATDLNGDTSSRSIALVASY